MLRAIKSITSAQETSDGDGVALLRNALFDGSLDPFLMLDQIQANPQDKVGAFPVHPHRGIQTLSYIIHGGMRHKDSMGNASQVTAGGIQWMHTGRGIEHAEVPLVDESGLNGFQFWLNVPREEKFQAPQYQDMDAAQLPCFTLDTTLVKPIAGTWQLNQTEYQGAFEQLSGHAGLIDIVWPEEETLILNETATTLAAYIYRGSITINGDELAKAGQLVQFSAGNHIEIEGNADSGLLLFKGEPIGEPIVHRGPFVMTTQAEIEQTLQAYRDGSLVY